MWLVFSYTYNMRQTARHNRPTLAKLRNYFTNIQVFRKKIPAPYPPL